MGQKKLLRFAAINSFPNVLQYPVGMPGRWNSFFKNENPVTLELACGKGEYSIGLARLYPNQNFLGIDIKGNRIYAGALEGLNNNLPNAGFLRIHISQIEDYFSHGEVNEIWITFPDPQLRTSKARKRLTHPRYLRLYQSILKPNGRINLKTDSPALYHFTKFIANLYDLQIEDDSEDVYARADNKPEIFIRTHYEKLDIAETNKVYYLRFTLPREKIPSSDKNLQEVLKHLEKAELI